QRRGSTWVKALAFVVVPLLVLAGGAAAWWRYVQGQYYVAPSDGMVAIYQGIPDRIGSFNLSHLASTSDTAVADLQPVWQERVRATIRVTDLATAQNTIAELKQKSALCIAQRSARAKATETPTPTFTPTPTDPASPSTSPILTPSVEVTPSSSLSPVASPTPSVSTAPAPEEC
ncbi:MAG TPA: hypothetical protein DEH05_06575, partial [Propionibacteriaceae bacterium]|nr:hypothetical protein [Propionibacteriaceae bacterium]